jgi:hypothetical protein
MIFPLLGFIATAPRKEEQAWSYRCLTCGTEAQTVMLPAHLSEFAVAPRLVSHHGQDGHQIEMWRA